MNINRVLIWGFPGGSVVKNLPANAGDSGAIPGHRRSPVGGKGNPLQYSCLGNPVDRGAWWAAVYGFAQSWTRLKQLSSSNSSVYMFILTAECIRAPLLFPLW